MASISRKSDPCSADYDEVYQFLAPSFPQIAEMSASHLASFRRLHKCIFVMMSWRTLARNQCLNRKVFLEEIASDSVQLLPHVLQGHQKSCALLMRGIVENLFRHLYFYDHPVEFRRMESEGKWYVSWEELTMYVLHHPDMLGIEKKFDAVNRLKTAYDELSGIVHGRKVAHMQMRRTLKDIEYSGALLDSVSTSCLRVTEPAAFMISWFHSENLHRIDRGIRDTMRLLMPVPARRMLSGVLT